MEGPPFSRHIQCLRGAEPHYGSVVLRMHPFYVVRQSLADMRSTFEAKWPWVVLIDLPEDADLKPEVLLIKVYFY